MSKQPLWRTPHLFPTAAEAVEFFNENRAEGLDPIPQAVTEFLESIHDFEPDVLFNVQPGFRTHYVAAAHPDDHHPWCFAKPSGVVFQVGDERNARAIEEMWGISQEARGIEPPASMLSSDVWFAPGELAGPGPAFCLRLSSTWAEYRVAR